MKNKKFIKKIFTICCCLLLVLSFGILSIPSIKIDNVLAETVPDSVLPEGTYDNSQYLDSELLRYIDGAVASGQAETFDYYSFDEKIYDEWVILYDFDLPEIEDSGYRLLTLTTYYVQETSSNLLTTGGLQFISAYSSTPSGNYTTMYVNQQVPQTNLSPTYTSTNYQRYPSYIDNINQTDDGYFVGAMFQFSSAYKWRHELDPMQDTGFIINARCYDGSSLSTYRDLHTVLGLNSRTDVPARMVYECIDVKFITLSSLVNYAYSQGYSGYSPNGIFEKCTYDVEMEFEPTLGSGDSFVYLLENVKPIFRNGFFVFNNLSGYEYVSIDSTNHIIDGDDYIWSDGIITIHLPYALKYDNPYFLFLGDGAVSSVAMSGFDIYQNEVEYSFDVVKGYIQPINSVLFVDTIYLPAGRGYDLVSGFKLKDYSNQSSEAYNRGYNDGYNTGWDSGNIYGYDRGNTVGYNQGYSDALDSGNLFTQFFSAIIDVPVKTFIGIFDIDILGVNMKTFFLSLLGIVLVLSLVKFFIGLGGGSSA